MSASENSRFNEVTWRDVNEKLSNEVRSKVPNSDKSSDEEEQPYDSMGGEIEHIVERSTSNGPRAVTREFSDQHLRNIAEHEKSGEVDSIATNNEGQIAGVEIETANGDSGYSEYDVGPEKEDVTGVVNSIGEILEDLDEVEQATLNSSPDSDVEFKRQGILTEMMERGSGGDFDWNNADRNEYPGQEYLTAKPRYFAFDDTYPGVMQVSGTGSIQVTMRPKIYDEHIVDGETDEDKWISDFSGGGENIGMHALSPLFYGPFMASPVIDEQGNIETLNGRDKAYGEGFQSEWDSEGNGKTPEEYVTEESKAIYSPSLADVKSIEDLQDFKANSEWTFSNAVEIGKMKVVPEGESYDSDAEYEVLSEHVESLEGFDFLDEEDSAYIRVGHEDWDLYDGRNVINLSEFQDHEKFEGKIYLVDENGEKEEKRVVVDYQDEELFPEMDDEQFLREYMGHFMADATSVWEPFRMRPNAPAFEYRDIGTNPYRDAAIATQVGAFRKWREIQDFAEDELGLEESDAKDLRLGTNYQGFDYEVKDGISLQDAWLGTDEMDSSLYEIISEGVEEMSGENYSIDDYHVAMIGTDDQDGLISNGLTPAEMMASEMGVDVDGEVLYEDNDRKLRGIHKQKRLAD